jgi:deoxycytidine triphosphate deaminase
MLKHAISSTTRTTFTDVDETMVSSNAIDLRLGRVFAIQPDVFLIDENRKKHRPTVEVHPDGEGYFTLPPGSYEVVMQNSVNVADGEAGWLIARSTLNRNGVFITSGLYDSAFSGPVAGVMHVTTGAMKVQVGTRIAQFLVLEAEMVKRYSGDYGYDEGGKPRAMESALYAQSGRAL